MTKTQKPGAPEVRDSREPGKGTGSVRVAPAETMKAINDALGLQMISIRLPKSVIDDFKSIAKIEGIGYQPLMRTALVRFAECEAKRVMREYAAQVTTEAKDAPPASAAVKGKDRSDPPPPNSERKAA